MKPIFLILSLLLGVNCLGQDAGGKSFRAGGVDLEPIQRRLNTLEQLQKQSVGLTDSIQKLYREGIKIQDQQRILTQVILDLTKENQKIYENTQILTNNLVELGKSNDSLTKQMVSLTFELKEYGKKTDKSSSKLESYTLMLLVFTVVLVILTILLVVEVVRNWKRVKHLNIIVLLFVILSCMGCGRIDGEYCDKTNNFCMDFMDNNQVLVSFSLKNEDGTPFQKNFISTFKEEGDKIIVSTKTGEVFVFQKKDGKLISNTGNVELTKR